MKQLLIRLAAAAVLISGCASGPTRYIHPNADLGAIKKVWG